MLLRKLLEEVREAVQMDLEEMVANAPEPPVHEMPGEYQTTGYSAHPLFNEAEKERLQALQVKIYSVRNQIFTSRADQSNGVYLLLSQVEMYHTELNEITETACARHTHRQ